MRNVVLLASLAVNLFLVGLIAGGHLFAAKPPPEKPEAAVQSIADDPGLIISRQNVRSLPPEYREQARQLIKAQLPRIRDYDRQIRQARQEFNNLSGQETYDEKAVEEAMQKLRGLQFEQQNLVSQTMLDFLAQLPAEERVAMIKRAKERQAERRHRQKRIREEFKRRRDERHDKEAPEPAPEETG